MMDDGYVAVHMVRILLQRNMNNLESFLNNPINQFGIFPVARRSVSKLKLGFSCKLPGK